MRFAFVSRVWIKVSVALAKLHLMDRRIHGKVLTSLPFMYDAEQFGDRTQITAGYQETI